MTQTQLEVALAQATQTNKRTAALFLEALSSLAYKAIRKEGEFVLPGFGKLVKHRRKALTSVSPKTLGKIEIPAKTVVRFQFAKAAKDRARRIPKFEIEDAGAKPAGSDDLDAALSEARERGVSRAVEILFGPEMLSAADFGKFIGISREAVRTKHQRNEVLGLQGAKRGLRYPKWQVTTDGALLPELPRLFEALGGESWTVYRFLTQHHPELEGDTALSALQRGKVEKVLAAAENTAGAFS
jgi:nucleoid DNA-binding protein